MRALPLILCSMLAGVAVLAIKPDAKASDTEAPASSAAPPISKVNYAEHVAAILNTHCVECHRPGEVAPFSLIGYDNAKKWAKMAATVTGAKQMPPWKPVHGFDEFLDENRLSPMEIETIKRWEAAGAPRGDPKKEPAAPNFAGEWALGQPDAVLEPGRDFKIGPEGKDIYRNFVMNNDFKEPVWVTAMTVKPGNPRVVHHVIAFLDRSGRAMKLDAAQTDGQPGYETFGGPGFLPSGSLGGWAPGLRPRMTPPGTAFKVEPGTKIVLQVHYHRTGKEETDKTRVGLYFSKVPVTDEMHLDWMLNPMIAIPPGEKSHRVTLTKTIRADVTVYSVMPHMHLLGRSMKAWVTFPDGGEKPLIYVDKWDFNWQMAYMLKRPLHIPAGSKVHVEAFYDNSSNNPNNPSNPPKLVTFGEQTTDEMFLLVAAYTLDRK
ncbi:MAG: ascorbate-dependent monooxygenase [Fimbriimonadales bacterium]